MSSEGFKVSTLNGVKVYNLTAGKALPSFLSDRQKRNLNKRAEFQHRVQLVQRQNEAAVAKRKELLMAMLAQRRAAWTPRRAPRQVVLDARRGGACPVIA